MHAILTSFHRFLSSFTALRYRNYRLYFLGQSVSLIGTWMQHVAISWLCYRLTNSVFLLGLLGFVANLPLMLLTPITGVLADRWDRHKMMIWVQVWEMGQAIVLAVLTLGGWIQIWHLVILTIILGVIGAIDAPNRHAYVVHLVEDRRHLANAIALNSATFNSARLIGPSVAGILIALVGEGVCFLFNAVSFLAVIACLLAMKMTKPVAKNPAQQEKIWVELKQGFSYTFGHPVMRLILIHFALVSMLGTSFSVLMPVMARDVLHGGASTLGFLTGALGLGALASAILLAGRQGAHGLDRLAGYSSLLFGLGLVALSLSRNIPLSLAVMILVGMGMVAQMTTSNTYLHTVVEDKMRARVMGFYLLAFFASMPLGSLLTGLLAEAIGAPHTILLCGLACLVSSAYYMTMLAKTKMKEPA